MKCFYGPKDHLACLIVLWFEPEVEPIPLIPEVPLCLDKITPGERAYVINNVLSFEQAKALEGITETIWLTESGSDLSILELVWKWFSSDPMPDKLYITFSKPHAHYLAIDMA